MDFTEITIRIVSSFFVLLLLTRIMGRKELRQLTFFNFVSGIAVGSIAASLVVNQYLDIWAGIYALCGWAILTIIMGVIDIKSKKAREVIQGQPMILIKQGKIMEDEMRKARLDINALNAMLRKKNVFSVADVDYAIFESDGTLSVMKKDNKQTITKSDMNIQMVKTEPFPISTEVISDGKINKKNLSKLNLNENWLDTQLKQAEINSISDIFFAEIQKDGTLYIDTRDDHISKQ
ncbi:YetF domain-containing protein [Gracilibacillus sp. D59]|uniref:YetF domain-containing protein n=1 Tax=Gracilibacillus sp. D59 TaxID=3457434 RepID=UPI003FCD8BBC